MPHNVLVVGFGDRVFNFPVTKAVEASTLRGWLDQRLGTGSDYHLTRGGAPLEEADILCEEEWGTTLIRAHPVLCGGKGGFGALIRAVGSRANRSGNKEACRDLSGRRLRDVNAQKNVTKWLEDEPERKRRKQEEKRKRRLTKKVPPKHFFDDRDYMEQLRSTEEGMDDALKQGLEASGQKGKLPASNDTAGPSSAKKSKFWVGGGEEDLSESSEGDSDSESHEYKGVASGAGTTEGGLNSAGSSDEAAQSKPSDEEDMTGSAGKNRESSDGGSEGEPSRALAATHPEGDGETVGEGEEVKGGIDQAEIQDREVDQSQDKAEVTESPKDDVSTKPPKDDGPLDLNDYSSAGELESVGAERLKSVLQSLGLKCGGTLQERAARLFSTKGKSLEDLDPSLFAKAGKSRKRKNKAQ